MAQITNPLAPTYYSPSTGYGAVQSGYDANTSGFTGSSHPISTISGPATGFRHFWRFAGVPIPKGSTITKAELRTHSIHDNKDTPSTSNASASFTFYAEAADNSAPLEVNVSAYNRARTSTAGTKAISWTAGAGLWQPANFTGLVTPVQQVVNRAGWVEGNALTLIADLASQSYVDDYALCGDDYDPKQYHARLYVEFTPPAGRAFELVAEQVNAPPPVFNSRPHKQWDGTAWVEAVRQGY